MKAIGKNIYGEEVELTISKYKIIDCTFKKLTELDLPKGIECVSCYTNQLTKLHLPKGIKAVYCDNNPIKEITLPKSIIIAFLPLNCNVLNINEFKNRDKILIKFM